MSVWPFRPFETIFRKCLNFCVKIPLTNKPRFNNYFVRLSISNSFTTYGRNSSCLYPKFCVNFIENFSFIGQNSLDL